MTRNSTVICKNCENTFEKCFKFCPHCGQQAKDNLTVGVLFYNTISNYFSFDARFFKSFLPLMLKPGYLAKKFVEGKRLLYLHPAQLYLFISVIFFFLMSTLIVRENVQNIDKALKNAAVKPYALDSLKTETTKVLDSVKIDSVAMPLNNISFKGINNDNVKVLDSLIKTEIEGGSVSQSDFGYNFRKVDSLVTSGASDKEIYKVMGMEDNAGYLKRKFYAQTLKFLKQRNGGQILQAAYDAIPVALFILLPIFALILKMLFYRKGTYAHHLVFSFYYFAFLFTVFSVILVVNTMIDIPGWIQSLVILSTFFYLLVAVKQFYKNGWLSSFIKTWLISFLYLSFVLPIAFLVLIFVGFLFY